MISMLGQDILMLLTKQEVYLQHKLEHMNYCNLYQNEYMFIAGPSQRRSCSWYNVSIRLGKTENKCFESDLEG